MRTNIGQSWWIVTVIALGCGPGTQTGESEGESGAESESEGEGEGESEGESEGEAGNESESGGETGEPEWQPIHDRGWMQVLGTNGGAWIERDDAVVPAACDGSLAATDGSVGLAYLGPAGDPDTLAPTDDPWTESELLDIEDVAPWPGLAAVSPIVVVSVDGQVIASDDGSEYARRIDLDPPSQDPHPLYFDVCETAFDRGACIMPGPSFPFEGCIGAERRAPEFTLTPSLTRDGDTWVFWDNPTFECETNVLAPSHPAEVEIGHQSLRITAGDLADGVDVVVTEDMLRWESSFKSAEECVDVPDKGSVCTCTWDYRETIAIERGTLSRDGDRILVDIKGAGADAEYLFWGAFPIEE